MAKTIIITGASRGIGLAIARFLIKEGHNVVVTARSRAALEELKTQHPQQVHVKIGDAADQQHIAALVDSAIKEFQRIDGLIINHGTVDPVERISNARTEAWKQSFDANFFSAVSLVQLALPHLRKTEGRIIFTSSGVVNHSYSAWGAYCASKCALKSLGSTLALEEKKVTTISITPGVVDTDMQGDIRSKHASIMDEKDSNRFITLHKEGNLNKPEQPGNVIARLAINGPKELSGEIFSWNSEKLAAFQD